MKIWKFWQRQPEQREQPYSDAIVQILQNRADGDSADDSHTATEETIAGLWARAFASAEVTPATRATAALTPARLATIGRELYRNGQVVFEIVFSGGQLQLQPVSHWNVTGTNSWQYELTIAQPSAIVTRYRGADAVVHLQLNGADIHAPWTDAGPGQRAGTTKRLLSSLERRMADEANTPVGSVVPVPSMDGTEGLQQDIKGIKGANILVPSTVAGDFVDSAQPRGASRSDWEPRRLGPNFPTSLEPIRAGVSDHLAAAGGVPAPLVRGDSEGTARRESWRQFLHGTIGPIAGIIAGELQVKLMEPDLKLTFDGLFASDLSGRARAFQSMVKGGMSVQEAAALAGLMEGE